MSILSYEDALAKGSRYYFLGTACGHGHVGARYTRSRACFECNVERSGKWQTKNRPRVLAYNKRRYEANREENRAKANQWRMDHPREHYLANKAWAENNREKVRASFRKHYHANPEKHREKKAVWRAANKDGEKAYRAANIEMIRTHKRTSQARRRAKKAETGGSHTIQDIADRFNGQRQRCAYCRISLKVRPYHVDHMVAIAMGGSNAPNNIQILCPACNIKKSAKDPIIFAQSVGLLI